MQTFEEATKLAHLLSNELVESKALLGLGDIYSKKGQMLQARNYYYDAQKRLEEQLPDPVYSIITAETLIRRARLAVFTGRLDEATSCLTSAHSIMAEHTFAPQVEPAILLAEGQLLLTRGDFSQAETDFSGAYSQAEALQEPLLAAEAQLGLAQTRLSRKELDAASASFLQAGRQFQLLEYTDGDGEAMLGIAQTLIGRGQWDEAIEHCEGASTRFNQSGNLIGEADTTFALGLAPRGKDNLQDAARNFEQAVTLYQQHHLPLGESDARYERAGIMLAGEQFDLAMNDLNQAIALVEQVMNTLSSPDQWSTFLHQYTELYAHAAITEVRRNQDTKARSILSSFIRITGKDPIIQYIKAYEDSILTTSDEMSENEAQANSLLVKRLRALRKSL
jgi:tetratricopeptide (TPR) repeat protein